MEVGGQFLQVREGKKNKDEIIDFNTTSLMQTQFVCKKWANEC